MGGTEGYRENGKRYWRLRAIASGRNISVQKLASSFHAGANNGNSCKLRYPKVKKVVNFSSKKMEKVGVFIQQIEIIELIIRHIRKNAICVQN